MTRFVAALGSATVLVVVTALALNLVTNRPGIGTASPSPSPAATPASAASAAASATPTVGPTSRPAILGGMWPQTSGEELLQAQRLADAGDPAYTWQLAPKLAADDEPWGAEIFARFIEEELGWEEFAGASFAGYMTLDTGGRYESVLFIRCAPGQTNPLSPLYADAPPEIRGCAPTIDELTYETVAISVTQPGRRGPSGIWVVDRLEILQPKSDPGFLSEPGYPDYLDPRQVEQVAPPSDAEVTAFLQAFLRARVDGEGAEQYLLREPEPSPYTEVPLLYATTSEAPYERSEFERLQGPVWPNGWMEYKVRLFAQRDTVVEQRFHVVRHSGLQLGLRYAHSSSDVPTTENGQSVPVPYSFLDGEVTFAAAPPWRASVNDLAVTRILQISDTCRGTGWCADNFVVTVADPMGCEAGPAPADADALARSIRSNPDLESTAPVAVSVGGIDALRMDMVAASGVSDCDMPLVLAEHVGLLRTDRMRLYLLDLPGGSARILAIAMIARDPYGEVQVPESDFEHVVEAAAHILDSFEFHTP